MNNTAMVVFVTIPQKKAKTFVKALLEERACACVNILKGVESFFWWQGKIDSQEEALLIIKTKQSAYSKLKKIIKLNHPYDLPEIIGFKIDKIDSEYQKWLNKETNV
ncbi:MAG: divalent-cation tolerance protein CutA [Candidatus Omnitrophica bacterium]|nr:divalent-cation tolerance protein CutA [Candidatus Omnitrophota bacterium]